ncbi:phytoene/squalene synthase family protein [Halalkalicoccus sp. NIPERK01]|uniref:phytoene/squalene synthase family protein n=1 Tax=Halalkalicoccus sp. NIPERK01 TaxID=3053469 RepID=UPI00256F213C|nr:phytoene/squalene synthase family protein [Halalkalicoccus sp. NIPERK01]MDL5362584.1 phytoene/squalene synthase family protein [Halalkalicoccus sp. NIPERK01]
MVERDHIARSKAIHRRTGRTFYYATRLLPGRVREATYVLYAFFRIADEVVDDADGTPPEQQRRELESIRAQALGRAEPDGPVLEAFQVVTERHGIDDEDVETFVDAMVTDIETRRYETYAELESYMNGSAAAVGRMMTAVMEPEDPDAALPHATALGEAFQLTNFVRDVREDVIERDRIYLPRETLAACGVADGRIERFEMNEDVARAIRVELTRAESLYREGVAGIKYLPRDCQLPVLLAAVLYAEHHRLIRRCGYDVLNNEPELGTLRKLWLVALVRWHWQWNSDPEAVFDRVSAVPDRTSRTTEHHHESLPTR